MPCNPRHVPCPDGCGQNVWRFHSKRMDQDYYCDTNSHRNYHVCPDEEPPLKVKPKVEKPEPQGLPMDNDTDRIFATADDSDLPVTSMTEMTEEDKESEYQVGIMEKSPDAFQTAEQELKFQQGFRLLEIRISKGRRVGNETIPELPEYRHFDYFQSRNIAVDHPDMDVADLIRRQYLEIDTTINEQIAQDRAKVIQALEAQRRK